MVDVEKYHGTGNDFLVVDATQDVPHRRAFARRVCDRDDGIDYPGAARRGADGVLFLALEAECSPPRTVMTLVQPDGSVAAMCGNGARCAAKWASERTGGDAVMLDTPSGTRRADLHADGTVTIEMGRPRFEPRRVPVAADEPFVERDVAGLTVTAVDTGVPHAVAFVDHVDAVDLETLGPRIRDTSVFPEGVNVTLAAHDDDGFRQRTFERGVAAETRSCGTGAVAVAAVADRLGKITAGEPVQVSPPGGDLEVVVAEQGATLRGPVVHEYSADVAATATANR